MKNYSKTSFSVLAILIFVIFAIGSSDDSSTNNKTISDDSDTTTNVQKKVVKQNWLYQQDLDKMTNKKIYYAYTNSTNKIDFEFPYEGGSSFQLLVRNMNNKNEVILSVSKGQFMSSYGNSEYLRVKFDDEQVKNYTFNSPDDGSSDLIFISNPSNFISNLKTSKKLMIEAPFFDAGRQIIYFDVDSLKWDK